MNVAIVLDIINIGLILIGILIILFSGILSKYINNRNALLSSSLFIFVISFGIFNIFFNIKYLRIFIIGTFLFVIVPLIIAYILIWSFSHNKTTNTRLVYSTFISWLFSLTILSNLRLLLGWGFESAIVLIILGMLLSILMGLLSGTIGNYLIYKFEKINPSF